MKLVVCAKDVDATLQRGDLISWHKDGEFEGKKVGLYNSLMSNVYLTKEEYLVTTPFIVLNLPLVTYEDIRPIIEETTPLGDASGSEGSVRKWKLDVSNLEPREPKTYFDAGDISVDHLRWKEVLPEPIRRDTLTAYNEITLPTLVIADILVLR